MLAALKNWWRRVTGRQGHVWACPCGRLSARLSGPTTSGILEAIEDMLQKRPCSSCGAVATSQRR